MLWWTDVYLICIRYYRCLSYADRPLCAKKCDMLRSSDHWHHLWDTRDFLVVKGPAADAADALQPWGFLCNPVMKMMMIVIFCPFPSNGAPAEWNWQGKTEVLGEKPVTVPLCPPQIPHGLSRDRTRASAMWGRLLTAWAMTRPDTRVGESMYIGMSSDICRHLSETEGRYRRKYVYVEATWLLTPSVGNCKRLTCSPSKWIIDRLRMYYM
jgi:hypothetical protein